MVNIHIGKIILKMAKTFNAPVRYFGGKGGMYNNILKYFPSPIYDTYIEPFSGSYSVGLHMQYVPPIEIYNDMNKNIYSLFYVLRNNDMFLKFKAKCDLAIYSDDFRKQYKENLKRPFTSDADDMIQRAFEYFYVNKTSHNGIGGFSINTIVRRNMSKSVSDMLSSIDRLQDLHIRLSKVIVSSEDGISLIDKYGQRDNVFMYCDPPYHQSTRTATRYDVDMDDDIQERFIDSCINAKCKLLISGYNCDAYKRLEDNGFKRIDFVVHTIGGDMKKKDKVESLWLNYQLSEDVSDFEPLWA